MIGSGKSFRNVSFLETPSRPAPLPPLRPIFTLPIDDVFNLISMHTNRARNRPSQKNNTANALVTAMFKTHFPKGLLCF
jgi:hypothetical protein